MATLDLDGTEQPIDPKLVMAIESAFRTVSLTPVEFVPAPRAWRQSNPTGSSSGPKAFRKANIKIGLAKQDGFQCAYCAREFVDLDDATLDHVIPNSIVGHWEPWNLVLACHACNHLKADRVPLVLMPLLCVLLRELAPLARTKKVIQDKRAAKRARQKKERREKAQASERQAMVRKQIAALSGAPVRLALEAPKPRAALLPGEAS